MAKEAATLEKKSLFEKCRGGCTCEGDKCLAAKLYLCRFCNQILKKKCGKKACIENYDKEGCTDEPLPQKAKGPSVQPKKKAAAPVLAICAAAKPNGSDSNDENEDENDDASEDDDEVESGEYSGDDDECHDTYAVGDWVEAYLPEFQRWSNAEVGAVRMARKSSRQELELWFPEDDTFDWVRVRGSNIRRINKPTECGGALNSSDFESDDG